MWCGQSTAEQSCFVKIIPLSLFSCSLWRTENVWSVRVSRATYQGEIVNKIITTFPFFCCHNENIYTLMRTQVISKAGSSVLPSRSAKRSNILSTWDISKVDFSTVSRKSVRFMRSPYLGGTVSSFLPAQTFTIQTAAEVVSQVFVKTSCSNRDGLASIICSLWNLLQNQCCMHSILVNMQKSHAFCK